jgi:DNA-directed RNA polymerase specialized sigma subunit
LRKENKMTNKELSSKNELENIKKLLILLLLKLGTSQSDIAATLGISQSTVSRMTPGKITPFEK